MKVSLISKEMHIKTTAPCCLVSLEHRCCLIAQLCPTACDLMDCSLPGSFAHGIFQARILGGVPIPPIPGSNLHLLHLLHWQVSSTTSTTWQAEFCAFFKCKQSCNHDHKIHNSSTTQKNSFVLTVYNQHL